MGKEILLVTVNPVYEAPLLFRLEHDGFGVETVQYAIPALRKAKAKPYDLVITSVYISAGEDGELDERVGALIREHRTFNLLEWGVHLILGTRADDSPNRDTPIIAADLFIPNNSRDGNIAGLCKAAGANEYLDKSRGGARELTERARHYLNQ